MDRNLRIATVGLALAFGVAVSGAATAGAEPSAPGPNNFCDQTKYLPDCGNGGGKFRNPKGNHDPNAKLDDIFPEGKGRVSAGGNY